MTDGDAYRDYIAAACALATTVDVTDRIATDPSYPGDRIATADRRRKQMLADDLAHYRTAQAAFLATVSGQEPDPAPERKPIVWDTDAAGTMRPLDVAGVW